MKKILVVDDDEDILFVVKIILEKHGFEVRTHATGLGVHDVVIHYLPNLILLDIRLPGRLGTEICKELKKVCSIPIILFSAHIREAEAIEECGADCFIQKPFDIDNLVTTINTCLN
jgi:DNA-binding response OmpR family regulator